jgi:hypothetical protein
MKFTYIICTLLAVLLISTAITVREAHEIPSIASEEEAVKKVIVAETEAFWNKDFK